MNQTGAFERWVMFNFWNRAKSKTAPTGGRNVWAATNQKKASANSQAVAPSASSPVGVEPVAFEVVASLLTDVGCRRQVNEDSSRYVRPLDDAVLADKGLLAIVADGVGGHAAGEVASRLAVEVINRVYYDEKADAGIALRNAFQAANREIHDAAQQDISLYNLGTTCVALVLRADSALWAHVGDSRLYLIREGEIYGLTEDHSVVMEMVKLGLITPEEARHHAQKNVILRALGNQPDVEIDVCDAPLPVKAGDKFLLCSDGLYDLVSDQEIQRAVTHKTPHAACESLITLAKERGGFDNITIAVLSLKAKAAPARATREVAVARGA